MLSGAVWVSGGIRFSKPNTETPPSFLLIYSNQRFAILRYCGHLGYAKAWLLHHSRTVDAFEVQEMLWNLRSKGIKLDLTELEDQFCVPDPKDVSERNADLKLGNKLVTLPKIDPSMKSARYLACLANSDSFKRVLDCVNYMSRAQKKSRADENRWLFNFF